MFRRIGLKKTRFPNRLRASSSGRFFKDAFRSTVSLPLPLAPTDPNECLKKRIRIQRFGRGGETTPPEFHITCRPVRFTSAHASGKPGTGKAMVLYLKDHL